MVCILLLQFHILIKKNKKKKQTRLHIKDGHNHYNVMHWLTKSTFRPQAEHFHNLTGVNLTEKPRPTHMAVTC